MFQGFALFFPVIQKLIKEFPSHHGTKPQYSKPVVHVNAIIIVKTVTHRMGNVIVIRKGSSVINVTSVMNPVTTLVIQQDREALAIIISLWIFNTHLTCLKRTINISHG